MTARIDQDERASLIELIDWAWGEKGVSEDPDLPPPPLSPLPF